MWKGGEARGTRAPLDSRARDIKSGMASRMAGRMTSREFVWVKGMLASAGWDPLDQHGLAQPEAIRLLPSLCTQPWRVVRMPLWRERLTHGRERFPARGGETRRAEWAGRQLDSTLTQ